MLDSARLSRPLATAAGLGELAPDHHRFVDKQVLLTGESDILATANGRECLLSSLRLLTRICRNLSVKLPACADSLFDECQTVANSVAVNRPVEFPAGAPDFGRYDAILSIGKTARPDLPWTVINSQGWLARASSRSSSLPADCHFANPVGALAASCLGVAEVFKRLIHLKETRGRLVDGLIFSLYSYRCQDGDPGPALPAELPLDILLVGAGAIGNGIIHLLDELPTSGHACVVDAQRFRDENLGTCLLIGPDDLDVAKAIFAEKLLGRRLSASGFHEDLETFQHRLGTEIRFPRIVLNALDDIDARHTAQKLWPDLILDGAIGDFPCQVARHHWGDDSACIICLFRHPPGPAAEAVASAATGLSRDRAKQADATVSEDDVRAAPADRQAWLRERIGKPICSVISEGVAQQISADRQPNRFSPSVPFVACFSACMVVAELVKFITNQSTELQTRYQFDMLTGPANGSMIPQDKRRDCECHVRQRNINTWREQRS